MGSLVPCRQVLGALAARPPARHRCLIEVASGPSRVRAAVRRGADPSEGVGAQGGVGFNRPARTPAGGKRGWCRAGRRRQCLVLPPTHRVDAVRRCSRCPPARGAPAARRSGHRPRGACAPPGREHGRAGRVGRRRCGSWSPRHPLARRTALGRRDALAVLTAIDFYLGRGIDQRRLDAALRAGDPDRHTPPVLAPSFIAGTLLAATELFDDSRAALERLRSRLIERGRTSELFVDAHVGRLGEARAAAEQALAIAQQKQWTSSRCTRCTPSASLPPPPTTRPPSTGPWARSTRRAWPKGCPSRRWRRSSRMRSKPWSPWGSSTGHVRCSTSSKSSWPP